MNKNKFKSILDNELQKENVSIEFIEALFANEKKSLFNNEKIEVLVKENFESLFKRVSNEDIVLFVNELYSHEEMRPFLESVEIVKYMLDNVDYKVFEDMVLNSSISDSAQKFVCDNFDYVISNYSIDKLLVVYDKMVIPEEAKYEINRYFENNKELFISNVLVDKFCEKTRIGMPKEIERLNKLVCCVVDKVLKQENCKIADTKMFTDGGFCNALCIGDKVVKVGMPRSTFNIPNDKRILQPYLRRDLREKYQIRAVIEISDRVDTKVKLSNEELYAIYKELRDRGIVYGDMREGNIGRLIMDNPPRNDVKNGMIGEISDSLEIGDYVILDTDFIYAENDPKIRIISDLSKEFETRYKNETIIKTR